ncbi:tetratricopeptide repeat-containing response regulator [Noviherbaspirillum autotrophicum]|uniref:tetratricopeptide repeat-containing response regulator n=1 Tax=Noviherbaspirillum autotrophicum TaxID=709839 RepID=UPI0018E0183D|nr:tetratricopeptide repeat-containing response regulator [Noviherbaspirillum autotrophicum]
MDEISALTVMFIEPSTNVRTSLHNIFTQCGITHIEHVMRASTAIGMLQKRSYDIILCEFDLSEGQDGQQLLEDLRRHRLLPLTTLFMMVTAERGQGKVISTLELAPNEYLLKPFTAQSLLERVGRALEKRALFMPVYRAMEHGDLLQAIARCEQGEARSRRYALDFRFMRAGLYLQQGQPVQAELLYGQLVQTKAAEWARLGLAKALHMQRRLGEAEEILTALLQENGKLWEAYDCLARVHEASGRLAQAKQVLAEAVALAPHTVRRLRKLGRLALEIGDVDTALAAFQEVAGKIRHSRFRDPEDYVHLVQALLGKGRVQEAGAIVHELGKSLSDFKKTEACGAISSALIHEHNSETERALERLEAAIAAYQDNAGLSNEVKMVLAQSCLNNGMEENAAMLMLDVMNNAADDLSMARAAATLERAGRQDLSQSLAEQSRQQAAELAASCEAKIAQDDYQGAVELMTRAAQKMADNPEVALNAAAAVLACIDHAGWDDELGAQAHRHIENARRLAPGHARLGELSDRYRATLKKYSIPFEHMSAKSHVRAWSGFSQ